MPAIKKGPKGSAQYFALFRKDFSKKELFLLNFAYDLSKYAHGYLEQVRDTGERYLLRPEEYSYNPINVATRNIKVPKK